jgi:hypothetical protein
VDLYKAIRELVEEKKRIDRIIASLEAMLAKGRTVTGGRSIIPKGPPKRRGRKSMSAEERRQVSERMARYWAEKRAGKSATESSGDPDAARDSSENATS